MSCHWSMKLILESEDQCKILRQCLVLPSGAGNTLSFEWCAALLGFLVCHSAGCLSHVISSVGYPLLLNEINSNIERRNTSSVGLKLWVVISEIQPL